MSSSPLLDIAVQRARLELVERIADAVSVARAGSVPDAQVVIRTMCEHLEALVPAGKATRTGHGYDADTMVAAALRKHDSAHEPPAARAVVAALLDDARGQVTEALSRDDWFRRWGVHYLPALMGAHADERVANFKDPGLQWYGFGKLFRSVRDAADALFVAMPPPTPAESPYAHLAPGYRGGGRGGRGSGGGRTSAAARGATASTATSGKSVYGSSGHRSGVSRAAASSSRVQSMRVFHNRSNPCFEGSCSIAMADGSVRRVDALCKGDRVATAGSKAGAAVACVVKTRCMGGMMTLTRLADHPGFSVTPYHPIRRHGVWVFPLQCGETQERPCAFVYSFILQPAVDGTAAPTNTVMVINGVECATLGHGQTGDVIGHAFYGTRAVVDNVLKLPGAADGVVSLEPGCCRRDPATDLVVELVA